MRIQVLQNRVWSPTIIWKFPFNKLKKLKKLNHIATIIQIDYFYSIIFITHWWNTPLLIFDYQGTPINNSKLYDKVIHSLCWNNLFYIEQLLNNNLKNLRLLIWIQVSKGKVKGVAPKWYDSFKEKLYDRSLYFAQQASIINPFTPISELIPNQQFIITTKLQKQYKTKI